MPIGRARPAMDDDTTDPFGFPAIERKRLAAAFDGGRRDRRTIGSRIVPTVNGVALAIILGDCNRAKIPENSSFASISLK